MVLPHTHQGTRRVVRRISTSSSTGCLLDCGPKRQGRELLRRRPCVPTSSRSFALEVLRRTIHSSSFLHCVGFPWKRFSVLFAFTVQVNRAACFPTHIEIRVDDPCQDACEGFGFQEKSKVVTLLKGVFTSYAYCCQSRRALRRDGFEFGTVSDFQGGQLWRRLQYSKSMWLVIRRVPSRSVLQNPGSRKV